MTLLRQLVRRLRSLFRRQKTEAEMIEEMRFHLDQRAEENAADGLLPDEARYAAQRRFGNVASIQEHAREGRGWMWLEETGRDVRFALRGLRKAPGFTFVAVATIAIGIGAGTAVFSLVNAILLRSLPVPNPQELRIVHWSGTDVRMRSINQDFSKTDGKRQSSESVNHPTFLRLREQAAGRAEVFGYFPVSNITAVSSRTVISADGLMVSDNFFTGLGVQALIGRVFVPGDDAAAQASVVIAYDVWQKYFGGDPGVLGQTVAMKGTDITIIGVLSPGFTGIRPGHTPAFYVSMSAASPYLYIPLSQDWHWFIRLMARLNPGQGDAQLASALSVAFAGQAGNQMSEPQILLSPGRGGLGFDRDAYGRPLSIMLGVTGLVMVVARCALAGLIP